MSDPRTDRSNSVRFYLGTHLPNFLWDTRFTGVPLFVSHNQLRRRKTAFPRAVTRYGIDSGAFSHLTTHGRWTETPEEYVAALRRYWEEIGPYDFAGQQDSICNPLVYDKVEMVTGHRPTALEHMSATVANYRHLDEIAPDLRIAPTVQGETFEDYMLCREMFEHAGVDLASLPVVGIGSLVGKPATVIERVATALHARGITRLHGFGVKGRTLDIAAHVFEQADSNVWSFDGRKRPLEGCTHKSPRCSHCPDKALAWYAETRGRLDRLACGGAQLALAI